MHALGELAMKRRKRRASSICYRNIGVARARRFLFCITTMNKERRFSFNLGLEYLFWHLPTLDCDRYSGSHQYAKIDWHIAAGHCKEKFKWRIAVNVQQKEEWTTIDFKCASCHLSSSIQSLRARTCGAEFFFCLGHWYRGKNIERGLLIIFRERRETEMNRYDE